MRAMCGSAAHWDFASQNKEDKLPEPAATRLLTQLVSFASQNKEDKSSPRREGLGFCFTKQGGLYGKRN